MYKSKLTKVIVSLLRRILGVTRSGAKRLMRAMLQALMAMGRRARLPVAGFVLPTVTMVLLVVILLTVAIVLRSFDRANTARNVRVNQQVLAAATPALDRAKAKINYLLNGPLRPTATPSDQELYRLMAEYDTTDIYSFGDETRLKLSFPLNGPTITNAGNPKNPPSTQVGATPIENEAINTAWRYPVDTNNDGLYDTFTLYGIFFRSPPRKVLEEGFTRTRKPLDARTPPMVLGSIKSGCEAAVGSAASLVGDSGWYRIKGKLQKSFFVYTVNVPVTADDIPNTDNPAKYKPFTGTTSISALEYQQDAVRIPLSNNAVVYEDDLDISPGVPLNLNGRILTNSNLLVSSLSGAKGVKLHQVSSPESCFYDQENSKIVVAGNLINGNALNSNATEVEVHLFQGAKTAPNKNPVINTANQSVAASTTSFQVLYNNNAYANRLAQLVAEQMVKSPASDPESVKLAIKGPPPKQRQEALEGYFKERIRKVPFAENIVPVSPAIEGSGNDLRPVDDWSLPTGPGTAQEGGTGGPTGLTLVAGQLQAAKPDPQPEKEDFLGDRINVGNNLPALRWDSTATPPAFVDRSDPQKVLPETDWNAGGGKRERTPQVTQLGDVGGQDRGGFWENSAAEIPKTVVDGVGGLRVITGAGVYERLNSFLPPPLWDNPATPALDPLPTYDDPAMPGTQAFPIVWSDSMPMSPVPGVQIAYNNALPFPGSWEAAPLPANITLAALPPEPGSIDPNTPKYAKGDLRMRATAVYHYAQNGYDKAELALKPAGTQPTQTPIACVSSYYDPSTDSTARNIDPLPDVSGVIRGLRNSTLIGSNNGVVYGWSGAGRPGALTLTNGLFTGGSALETQANYVFPDGRFANGPLREALQLDDDKRTLAQKAAIDSTQCSLDILAGAVQSSILGPQEGQIREVAFLNAREIKAIERDDLTTPVDETFTLSSPLSPVGGTRDPNAAFLKGNYNLALEDREPLEVRVTQLDIDKLRKATIGQNYADRAPTEEFLLPNSGIIYASRDDALPDRSDRTQSTTVPGTIDENTSRLASPTDARLDPSRKPNGIMLVNGDKLFRRETPKSDPSATDIVVEKGLTLVSNLPVYIQGNFNLHGRIDDPTTGAFTQVEEFIDGEHLNRPSWGNFYNRTTLDKSFACRAGDKRLPDCKGDFWRPATVLADSITVLSSNFRPGFRNEGDFDLRNNAGSTVLSTYDFDGTTGNDPVPAKLSRLYNGFFTNNFVTNGLSSGSFDTNGLINPLLTTPPPGQLTDATYIATPPAPTPLPIPLPVTDSSYFNNFVTPVQRRGQFPHYVMEVCVKLPTAACGPNDWYINPPQPGSTAGVRANTIADTIAAGTTVLYSQALTLATTDTSPFKAGTTANPPVPELQRFPRRLAFHRNTANQLVDVSGANVVTPGSPPQPLGIGTTNNVLFGEGAPTANSLWFVASAGTSVNYGGTGEPPYFVNNSEKDGNGLDLPQLPSAPTLSTLPANPLAQPLLMPVLQTQVLTNLTAAGSTPPPPGPTDDVATNTRWLPRPTDTSQNLLLVAGDTPSRAISTTAGDSNGGLQNLPRFLENWGPPPTSGAATAVNNIQGGFFQFNRSAYSTAPYTPILSAVPSDVLPPVPLQSLFALPPTPPPSAPSPYTPPPTRYNTSIGGAGTPISGRIPFFSPPTRNWGYDVGLLSQPPDLFTQRFTTPPTTPRPAEYFREVSRDDDWVKTLMCGVLENTPTTQATKIVKLTDPTQCKT
jgi:type II secretory pathway pseudopilin PulG